MLGLNLVVKIRCMKIFFNKNKNNSKSNHKIYKNRTLDLKKEKPSQILDGFAIVDMHIIRNALWVDTH